MKIILLKICSPVLFACLPLAASFGQDEGLEVKQQAKKIYLSTGMDGLILSSALLQKTGADAKFATPRFTGFFHIGVNFNYDFGKNSGIYAGLNIKNIGFIEQYDNPDSTAKRRVYTIGIPVGLKFGNIKEGNYFLVGGGVDFLSIIKKKALSKGAIKRNSMNGSATVPPGLCPMCLLVLISGRHSRLSSSTTRPISSTGISLTPRGRPPFSSTLIKTMKKRNWLWSLSELILITGRGTDPNDTPHKRSACCGGFFMS